MGHNSRRRIAVIGGGIGGLTAALAFARQGADVALYEKVSRIGALGAGLQLTPNGARALHGLGLQTALIDNAIPSKAVIPMDALTGRAISRFDLSAQSPPYRFLHRGGLAQMLVQACRDAGVTLSLGTSITNVVPDGSFLTDGQRQQPDLTIGADGIHSTVRGAVGGTKPSKFTGQVAWRAMIPRQGADPVTRIWMAPGRHLVTYPIPGNRLNIVAVQERDTWAAEGWQRRDDPANLRRAFTDCAPQVRDMLEQVGQVGLWGLFVHPVADIWYQGRVTILGDAAHPTLPFLAQGANLAIEDAYVLARKCDETADLQQALRRYQNLRRPRVARAIATANANGRKYHLGGIQRRIAHLGLGALGHLAPNAFINRLGWLYDHDVTA